MAMLGKPRLFCDCSGDKGRVKQQARPECDINAMVARARNGAMLPMRTGAFYFDCTTVPPDFQAAQDFFVEAQRKFDALPAQVRLRFKNAPQNLVEFVSDPANAVACREMGLLPPLPPTEIKPPEDKPAAPKSGDK